MTRRVPRGRCDFRQFAARIWDFASKDLMTPSWRLKTIQKQFFTDPPLRAPGIVSYRVAVFTPYSRP